MNKPTTIKELCEFIWYLEDKYDLLDLEIDGVKVWQSARMQLYYKLAQMTDVLSQPHTELGSLDKIKYILGYMKNSLIDNFFTLKKTDAIIFSHPRVVDVNGEPIDIYTKYFMDELKQDNINIVEFESAYLGIHKKEKTEFSYYTDWIILSQRVYKIFLKANISHKDIDIFNKVQIEIKEVCKVDIDLVAFFKKSIKTHKSLYKIYNIVFKKVAPKVFYTVISYAQAPIIKAAKDNGVEVIELQHGTLSKYHLGYSFPNRVKSLEYFPDKFYVWSEFWKKMIKLPIKDKNVVVDSFRYLEKQKTKFTHLAKKKNQIVVLSQGAIGNIMAEKFLENFEKFKNYDIKYKLHPGEFDRWQKYPALKTLSEYKNVQIVTNELALYELFATSSIQVGVFSTALYEGIDFNCKTILLNLSGIEYMDRLIAIRDDVELI